jgi:NOL1/NOP2/sun family putative RNA methylase
MSTSVPKATRVPAGPKIREWARRHKFDDWMVARFVRLTDRPSQLLEGLITPPIKYIRVNPIRTDVPELRIRMESRGFKFGTDALDPNVLKLRHAPLSPGATHEHLLGMTTPQDLASSAAPLAIDAGSAETIVDLAAAPGIKTLHLAGAMGNEGRLVAVDPNPSRMQALRFTLERCGVANTALVRADGQELMGAEWADKVLLDAPCTGEGTLPKDKSRRRGSIEEINDRCRLQSELTDAADRILRPGGTLVYATCTLSPEENEGQVQRLMNMGYAIEELPFDKCGGTPLMPGITEWTGLELDDEMRKAKRFVPGIHPTLGFFVAKLRKEGHA